MELRHLRYFVAVAEERSFSKAALRLHLAQPPLSMQIRALEEDLETELFDRGQRPVALTAAGEVFLQEARRLLADFEAARTIVKRTGAGEVGSLRVAFIPPLASDLLAEIIRLFRDRFPKVQVALAEMPSSMQAGALEAGEIDVGFMRHLTERDDFTYQVFGKLSWVLAVPAKHPLRRHRPVRWEHLRHEPLILLPSQLAPGFYDEFLAKCGRPHGALGEIQYANDMHTSLWLTSAGFGICPMIDFLRREHRAGLAFLELPPDTPIVTFAPSRTGE